jgi:hypothetical protein
MAKHIDPCAKRHLNICLFEGPLLLNEPLPLRPNLCPGIAGPDSADTLRFRAKHFNHGIIWFQERRIPPEPYFYMSYQEIEKRCLSEQNTS